MRGLGPETARVAAAAAVIAGVVTLAVPGSFLTVVRLVIVTVAAAAALHAWGIQVPTTGWISPFRWMSPFAPEAKQRGDATSDETSSIRTKLSGWRRSVAEGPSLPPDTLRLLRPLIASALELDLKDDAQVGGARSRLSPAAWAILSSDPPPSWLRTAPPAPNVVAEVVHRVLDELDHLDAGGADPPRHASPHPASVT